MFILSDQQSVACHFINELRHKAIQTDSMRFRRNMERIGELLAYEISKTLPYKSVAIGTQLGTAQSYELVDQPVLTTILRAGLPLYQGFLNIFDKADSAFVGAYRAKANTDNSFDVNMEYLSSPSLEGKTLIIIDPMLATGKSLLQTYQALLKQGTPARTHIATAIASRAGVAYLQANIKDCSLWIGAIDEELNKKYYIVPGLGDAGDLAFGTKL